LLVVENRGTTEGQPGTLSLFREDGTKAGELQLKSDAGVVAVSGAKIFIRSGDGPLQAIHRDGKVEVLSSAPSGTGGIGGLVASPDGKRWVWGSQTLDTSTQYIYAGGDGTGTKKLATLAYPTVLRALAWTAHGVLFDSLPSDYFGYRPFDTAFGASGGVRVMDPTTGAIHIVATPSNCVFGDQAADSTIACFPATADHAVPDRHAVRIVAPNGHVTDLRLAVPRFNYVGDAYFSPDGSMLTVAGATGAGFTELGSTTTPKPEEYATDLIRTSDGSISRFGPTGTRPAMGPQSWLPDGRLVLWRPDQVGGPPGLFILDPHGPGQGPEIVTSGRPVGYLTG
jgi:hypothetical protein